MRILLIEDNVELANITASSLKKQGFAVDRAFSAKEACQLIETNEEYDALILDLILPDADGMKLVKKIKSVLPKTPVLALTARGSEEDRVRGIENGFDDYLTKPFSHHELAARLRVLYRSGPHGRGEVIRTDHFRIFPRNHAVFFNKREIKLTYNEFHLLYCLAQNKGKVVSRNELLKSVWDVNAENSEDKVITAVSRLRKKIGDRDKKIIKTAQNGYLIS